MILPEIAIRRPVTTFMMMAALLVFGLIGYTRLGVDQYPKVDFPVVTVTTVLEGASPEVIEENITDVIEEEVATIEGVRRLTSISSHGASVVTVEFNMDRDIDLAAQDVRDRVNRILRELPDDAEVPVVDKLDIQSQPIMWIAVSGRRPIQDVTGYADDVLKPRLETVKGVGSIILGGKRERAIRVWLDRDRLEAYGLTSGDVVAALRRENVEIPGGFIESRNVEFSVKTEGKFREVRSFEDLIVAYDKGSPVRIRDIGRVEDGLEDRRSLARYNGEPAVGLGVIKKSGANTVELARLIKEELARVQKDLPAGIKTEVAFDASVFIEDSIEEMEFALAFGGLLAAVVVFFFLRNPTATIITGTTIPLAIIGSFVFIYFMGFTMNTMTMLALTLAIGVVIDDAIVIVDNIHRHREKARDSIEAARNGTNEIAFAAVATTFALAAVFIPVAFMKGIVGRFFFEFGITVAVAVFLSTFIALTFTPMLSSRFLRPTRRDSRFFTTMESFYSRVEATYRRLLAWALTHRALVVTSAVVIFLGSLAIWVFIGKEFIPPEDQSRFIVRFETPIGSTMDYTDEKLRFNEAVLKDLPEIKSFFAAVGLGDASNVNKGLMFVRMVPKEERERSQSEVVAFLRRKLNSEPGLKVYVMPLGFGFGARRGTPLEFIVMGPSVEELDRLTTEITERFKRVPGIVGVHTDFDAGLPEIRVYIDRDRAADQGVDTTTLASTINTLIGGRDVTKYKEGGKRYDVRVKLVPSQRMTPQDIDKLHVRNRDGRLVRLSGMIRIEEGTAPSVINRYNRQRSVTIFANMEETKTLGSAIDDISRIAEDVLPEGYTTELGGRAEQFRESLEGMLLAFFLAVLITYMVLGSLFESFLHPFTVMLALPLSTVGALGGLWLTGNTINIYSLIGLTLLVGLVTKNSILLVDYTNTLRHRGLGMREAVLEAGPVRLRPILMTALSTIFGVLPTALGVGPGSESRAPMAIAIVGGLFSSTVLTLVVIPVVYTLFDDLKGRIYGRRSAGSV